MEAGLTKGWRAAPFLVLALAGCQEAKETGPAAGATEAVPAVAPAKVDPVAAKPLASFAGMDADGDDRVTSAEHAQATQTMFRMMDGDADGSVTVAEMDATRALIGGTVALSSEKKIAAVDSDGDGKLTLAEHVAASNGVFARLDANDDGWLTHAEWDVGHEAIIKEAAKL